jgi:hypothetical protein
MKSAGSSARDSPALISDVVEIRKKVTTYNLLMLS